jgi:HEAT repeat protein
MSLYDDCLICHLPQEQFQTYNKGENRQTARAIIREQERRRSRMFAGLDEIDWHQLEHAYGAADDVPGWLRSLASQEDESDALTHLSLSLCHQGTVYSASAYAAPYLIELLTDEPMQGKGGLLRLLAGMAHGDAYHRQHFSLYSEARRQDPAFQRELAEEVVWAERTCEAVRQGLPVYLKLLANADPHIRMEAAYMLAQLKADAAATLPLLYSRLEQEDDQLARASLLLSLGVLGEPTAAARSLLEQWLETQGEEEHALIRYAAAISLVWLFRKETPETAVRVLVDLLTENVPEWLFDAYVELPWVDGRLSHVAGRTLRRRLSPERLRFALPRLFGALETVDGYDVDEVIRTLLYVAFGHSQLPEQVAAQNLTEEQRAVLRAIAQSHAAWHTPPGVYSQMGTQLVVGTTEYTLDPDSMIVLNDDLQRLGLPSSQHDLLDFLG